jgi:hypothetical protein
LDNPETVSGDPELPEFVLRMAKIWWLISLSIELKA